MSREEAIEIALKSWTLEEFQKRGENENCTVFFKSSVYKFKVSELIKELLK